MEANIKEEPPEVDVSLWEPQTEFCHVKMEPNSWSWHEDASSSRGGHDEESQTVASDPAARNPIKTEPWDDSEGGVAGEHREPLKLTLGAKFSSFEDLQMAFKAYKDELCCEFFKRDSRTLQGAASRSTDRVNRANFDLIYYDVKYCCKYGRQKGRPRKLSPPPKDTPTTFHPDCPAFMQFKLTADGRHLQLLKMNEDHNHLITRKPGVPGTTQELQMREIDETSMGEVAQGLSGAHALTGKSNSVQEKSFQCCFEKLKNKYKCFVEVLRNDEGCLKGLFFQTSSMSNTFSRFPEILFLDCTYKLLDFKPPLCVFLIEDSSGYSEIIGACILVEEGVESLDWMVNSFKHLNASWTKTRVILTDKEPKEREVLKRHFPDAKLLICLFRTMAIFRREVTRSKFGLTAGEETTSRDYLRKFAHSRSEEEYDQLYLSMRKALPQRVFHYFHCYWHPARGDWVVGSVMQSGNFWNGTSDASECVNSKLKTVVGRYSSVDAFADQFFVLVNVLTLQRNNVAAKKMQEVPVVPHAEHSPEKKYYDYVTEYALKLILSQLYWQNMERDLIFHSINQYSLKSLHGVTNVTFTSCDCSFFKFISLPCSHIFLLRHKLNRDLFEECLVGKRWTRSYVEDSDSLSIPGRPAKVVKYYDQSVTEPMSDQKKFRKGNMMCSKLVALMSRGSTETFDKRYELVNTIFNKITPHWEHNNEVTIKELCKELLVEDEVLRTKFENHRETVCVSMEDDALGSKLKNCNEAVCMLEDAARSVVAEEESTNPRKMNEIQGNALISDNEYVVKLENRDSVIKLEHSVDETCGAGPELFKLKPF